MLSVDTAGRRIRALTGILKNVYFGNVRSYTSESTVSIGDVVKEIVSPKNPELVPKKYYNPTNVTQSTLHHLRWMLQKDVLGQDMFLLGPPGPKRRHLAMQYLELTNREHEYVALNRDTTESDLKQRREIVAGTATYFDQSTVKAATHGRILILEGIEKAERNVLPVLNNLLENREMHLEDGRLLIPASRYDELLKQYTKDDLDKWKLVRVDENFRVIALGLPVPKYHGNPLDPPLRSRFQARDVHIDTYHDSWAELKALAPSAPEDTLQLVLSAAFALRSRESAALGLPDFPMDNIPLAALMLQQNPKLSAFNVLYRLYPYKIFLKDGVSSLEKLLISMKINPEVTEEASSSIFSKLSDLLVGYTRKQSFEDVYIENAYQNKLIQEMLQSALITDFCLIGASGCGKSICVSKIAEILGKATESIILYQDITSRDLLQQRTTLENGDTIWKLSPLVVAALEGKIAVIDGLHRIHPSTLSVLHRLVCDREMQLHDGKRLIRSDRFELIKQELNMTDAHMFEKGILKIHPDFRIIALAEPPIPNAGTKNWMSPEILSLFAFHEMRMLTKQEEMHIITSKYGPISKPLHQIIDLAHVLRNSPDMTLKNLSGHLSTRQLLRIASRLKSYPAQSAYEIIQEAFMIKFLPPLTRQALEKTISKLGIKTPTDKSPLDVKCKIENGILTVGQTTCPVYKTEHLSKVPNIVFYDVPQHLYLIEKLLQDFLLGEHLLLVGNQGVGKNKIADRFLELMNRPREYIQLHRDTTVQTLTIQPTVKDGVLVYEDSPLVRAVKTGHVLVIDEADKAPTHVTCILKTLVETGEMILSDGRRIVKTLPVGVMDSSQYIQSHPDFRLIVLANRPGFPFLGNDFFGALGDLFSSHAVDNPSEESEISLLQQYGPNVPASILKKLVGLFGELREMADQNLLNYPYSTREVVNIVKHLQQFPDTDVEDAILNVFDFDKYNPELVEIIGQLLIKHGFSESNVLTAKYRVLKEAKKPLQVTVKRYSGLDTSGPKHGKEDEKNEPHVGGNTWAGGTGGRDTAGLGGKGGPYRLDKGHKVHQLSDEEKAAVPEHIQRAAREMGRKAFEQKLKEIGMSGYDASIYAQFSDAVSHQVQSLRIILESLQAKNKERYWSRHQTSGELDDVKLIDGLLGEKTVFKRRTEQEPELGTPQFKPKLLRLVVDVSGSMYRFNSYDGRLDRELEAVVLVMEAFEGFQDKIQYDIFGHSGDTPQIEFVNRKLPPKNNKERLDVIRIMHAHSQYCWTGDHTLEATKLAVTSLAEEESDESIVVVLSDANLQRYGIPPSALGSALTACPSVSAYVIFIGGLGNQAEMLTEKLPAGRAFVCTDLSNLPQILKQIFSSSVVNV